MNKQNISPRTDARILHMIQVNKLWQYQFVNTFIYHISFSEQLFPQIDCLLFGSLILLIGIISLVIASGRTYFDNIRLSSFIYFNHFLSLDQYTTNKSHIL